MQISDRFSMAVQLNAIKVCRFSPYGCQSAPLMQQRKCLREVHLAIEFHKADQVTAAATAIAVEQVFDGIQQKARFAIRVQRTQAHHPAETESPHRLPIMSLQIVCQGNLLFQLVEILTTHGLLASMGRIRQNAPRSQTRMVDVRKKRPA
jgi:hypothetical protein